VKALLEYDSNIVEVIRFGSSVYMPEVAKDLDLLVFTRSRRDSLGYAEKALEVDLGCGIDVIPCQIGEGLRNDQIIISAFASGDVLHGDGHYLREMFDKIDPTMEDAYEILASARSHLEGSSRQPSKGLKDRYVRLAFNELFEAARMAFMIYLAIKNSRWGRIRSKLPKPHKDLFSKFIKKLHIDYYYQGNYPEDHEAEFENWHKKVERYIKQLEEELKTS
jgi:hypothetical protein